MNVLTSGSILSAVTSAYVACRACGYLTMSGREYPDPRNKEEWKQMQLYSTLTFF